LNSQAKVEVQMNSGLQFDLYVVLIGVGATLVMDAWGLLLRQFNVPAPNYALVGRWLGHIAKGRWFHVSIQKAESMYGETMLGWFGHYAIGVLFAALLVAVSGAGWIRSPSFISAVAVGVATVVVPLFILQPAMGAGVLSHKTASPLHNVIKSVANHLVFGSGLYLAGLTVSKVLPI
jgi:hypothetical protein